MATHGHIGGPVALVATLSDRLKLGVGIRRGQLRQRRLDQPLHDQVGVAPVWGSRVSVILRRQAKMASVIHAGQHQCILARAEQLDHR